MRLCGFPSTNTSGISSIIAWFVLSSRTWKQRCSPVFFVPDAPVLAVKVITHCDITGVIVICQIERINGFSTLWCHLDCLHSNGFTASSVINQHVFWTSTDTPGISSIIAGFILSSGTWKQSCSTIFFVPDAAIFPVVVITNCDITGDNVICHFERRNSCCTLWSCRNCFQSNSFAASSVSNQFKVWNWKICWRCCGFQGRRERRLLRYHLAKTKVRAPAVIGSRRAREFTKFRIVNSAGTAIHEGNTTFSAFA